MEPYQGGHFVHVRRAPLPPPSELENYEVVAPGAAKIIIDRAGEVQKHLLSIREKEASHIAKLETRGQCMAFIIAMFAIGGAIYLGANGYVLVGSGIGVAGFAIILSQFLQRHKK